jgi:two-component system, NarL family, sensor histidine kinase BarA
VFRRIQQLRISLAKKSQLLFGAAVLLIIAAALYLPWQRIEQLTEQLNEQAASRLADHALAQHVKGGPPPTFAAPSNAPATRAATAPATRTTSRLEFASAPDVRLTKIGARRDLDEWSKFEVRATHHFLRDRDSPFYTAYYEREDGSAGYRYARPLRFGDRCMQCHVAVNAKEPIAAMTQPTTRAARTPDIVMVNGARLIPLPVNPEPGDNGKTIDPSKVVSGIVSVDLVSTIDATQRQVNRIFILGALLLASALAITTFYYITTRLILQPVRVLQETADKVSQGDLNIRSDISTGDEFQQLSETFNKMLTNLKSSSDKLMALNKSLDLKLGQLAESNVALYESNRLKSEFLANVSHELRTPLNSILGFADLLRDTVAAPPDAKSNRYINNILTSGRHLLELINDLLDLAKIEAGRMEVRSEPLVISDTLEGLANLLQSLLQEKKLTLSISVAPDVPILHTDPGKLQQVLYNFLSNAIKFSPAGQLIEIKASLDLPDAGQDTSDSLPAATPRLPRPDRARDLPDEPYVRISVIDRGPGIAPDKQSVIFEKFRQIDGGHTRSHGGSGLGLAISKELMLLMGGTIGVKSKVGEGATFWILLPLKIDAGSRDIRAKLVVS